VVVWVSLIKSQGKRSHQSKEKSPTETQQTGEAKGSIAKSNGTQGNALGSNISDDLKNGAIKRLGWERRGRNVRPQNLGWFIAEREGGGDASSGLPVQNSAA